MSAQNPLTAIPSQGAYEMTPSTNETSEQMIQLLFSADFLLEGLRLNPFNLKHDFPKPKYKNNAYTLTSLPKRQV
jgi:hypothetical protein